MWRFITILIYSPPLKYTDAVDGSEKIVHPFPIPQHTNWILTIQRTNKTTMYVRMVEHLKME